MTEDKFNHDLLIEERDRSLAKRQWPAIFHVVDYPALKDAFLRHDGRAKRAKTSGRRSGLLAIGLGCLALFAASAEHLLQDLGKLPLDRLIRLVSKPAADMVAPYLPSIPEAVALVAAIAGVMSVMIGGMGVLHARKKHEWLQERLATEIIRQFHFRVLVRRLPDVLRSLKNETSRRQFLDDRDGWLAMLLNRLESEPGGLFDNIVSDDDQDDPKRLDQCHEETLRALESEDLRPVFDAYRELRINGQLIYAGIKLKDDHKIFSAYPTRQSEMFSLASLVAILGLFVIHLGVILGVLFPTLAFRSDVGSVVVIWLAVGALAIRAIEAGLQPEREIERYQAYRSSINALLRRFDRAQTAVERHRIMLEMERLAYDEMRNFLITNERSRYVI